MSATPEETLVNLTLHYTHTPSLHCLSNSPNGLYEGAEVETDINVLEGDICPRTSLCGHDVPAEDVHAEDVPVEDVPFEDMMSTPGLYVFAEDIPIEDILPRTSCPSADIMSSMGTLYPHRDILNGDVFGGDIYVHFYFCPSVGLPQKYKLTYRPPPL